MRELPMALRWLVIRIMELREQMAISNSVLRLHSEMLGIDVENVEQDYEAEEGTILNEGDHEAPDLINLARSIRK